MPKQYGSGVALGRVTSVFPCSQEKERTKSRL
jgi:hypothetical protein